MGGIVKKGLIGCQPTPYHVSGVIVSYSDPREGGALSQLMRRKRNRAGVRQSRPKHLCFR
jgi:hypothetical protein